MIGPRGDPKAAGTPAASAESGSLQPSGARAGIPLITLQATDDEETPYVPSLSLPSTPREAREEEEETPVLPSLPSTPRAGEEEEDETTFLEPTQAVGGAPPGSGATN